MAPAHQYKVSITCSTILLLTKLAIALPISASRVPGSASALPSAAPISASNLPSVSFSSLPSATSSWVPSLSTGTPLWNDTLSRSLQGHGEGWNQTAFGGAQDGAQGGNTDLDEFLAANRRQGAERRAANPLDITLKANVTLDLDIADKK